MNIERTMSIETIMQGIEEKGFYDIGYDILTTPVDYNAHEVQEIVMQIEQKRLAGWPFLMNFHSQLKAYLGVHERFMPSDKQVMQNMRKYWAFCARNLALSNSEMKRISEDTNCVDDPGQFLIDIFGKPGAPEQWKTRMLQAEQMPFNGLVQEGDIHQPHLNGSYKPRLVEVLRHKTFPRTLQKEARKIAELETAHKAKYGMDAETLIEGERVKRHDPLGIKLILFDENLVRPVSEFMYHPLNVLVQQAALPYTDSKVVCDNHYNNPSKNDNAIHIDIHFPHQRFHDLEIILTSKYDFWVDEFCGKHSHHKYMFTAETALSKENLTEMHDISEISKKELARLNAHYRQRVQELVSRGNQFLSLVHLHAGAILQDNVRYYFQVKW
jgi:hypothetical protein